MEEGRDPACIAHGLGKADLDCDRFTIHPLQIQPQTARAPLVMGKRGAESVKQPQQARHHIVLPPDRFGQGHPHAEMRRIHGGGDGFGLCAQHLIQPIHQIRTKAARQRGAGLRHEIGNAREAKAGEAFGRGAVDPQRRHRQGAQRAGQPSFTNHAARAVARQGMRRPPSFGNGADGA